MSLANQIIVLALLVSALLDVSSSPEIRKDPKKNKNVSVNNQSNLYKSNGADWTGKCKTGTRQSPIDIDPGMSTQVLDAFPIVFINYNLCKFKINLTPTTVNLQPHIPANYKLGITAGGLRGLYKLDSAHFHWGAEHTIKKQRVALELHLVHYKSIFPNFNEAKEQPNGVAVVGVLYKLGNKDEGLAKLIDAINSKSNQTSLTAEGLLPKSTNEFYRYSGSLTTPECDESVVWTIFKQQRTISTDQLNWFKKLKLQEGKPLEHTYRIIQMLNDRTVYHGIVSY